MCIVFYTYVFFIYYISTFLSDKTILNTSFFFPLVLYVFLPVYLEIPLNRDSVKTLPYLVFG